MKKTVYRILMAVCIGVCAISGWKLFEIWNENQTISNEAQQLSQYVVQPKPEENKQEKEEEPVKGFTVDFAKLKSENSDICGWIIVPGTDISMAVVQGVNNDYYLDHTTLRQPARQGAIFMDINTPEDLSSDNTLIYGHSVDVGGMFTSLNKFEDETFFKDHPYFWYLTPDQNYKCEIWQFLKTDSKNAAYNYDFGDYRDAVLKSIQDTSTYSRDMQIRDTDRFITLSTCDLDYGFNSQQRLVIMAVLKPWDKPIVLE